MKNNKYALIVICISFVVIGIWYMSFIKDGSIKIEDSKMDKIENNKNKKNDDNAYSEQESDLSEKSSQTENKNKDQKVCISGEILNPGVYSIKDGDRISDVIDMAGGTTENADLYGLNLSQHVKDEDNIIIPKKLSEEEQNLASASAFGNSGGAGASNNLININKADAKTLMTLDGIGEKIADSIIDYRNSNGGFKTIDEIKKVNRIGNAVYNKIKDKITV